jgi:uncharacterized protein YhhL (DUF1145 family)
VYVEDRQYFNHKKRQHLQFSRIFIFLFQNLPVNFNTKLSSRIFVETGLYLLVHTSHLFFFKSCTRVRICISRPPPLVSLHFTQKTLLSYHIHNSITRSRSWGSEHAGVEMKRRILVPATYTRIRDLRCNYE